MTTLCRERKQGTEPNSEHAHREEILDMDVKVTMKNIGTMPVETMVNIPEGKGAILVKRW